MRYITLAIAFLICTNSQAQIIRAQPFYVAPEAVSGNLLLDDYPGAVAAYSLRKLDKDYTGSAIRVRRKSDNTEQDVGFSGNYLDTAALKTFVGTGATDTAWVVTWYNQADSAGVFGTENATQSTATNQPVIIVRGNLVYKDNILSVDFETNDFMDAGLLNDGTKPSSYSINVLASIDVSNIDQSIIGSGQSNGATNTSYFSVFSRSSDGLKVEIFHGKSGGLANEYYLGRSAAGVFNTSNYVLINCYYNGGATASVFADNSSITMNTINAYTGNSGVEYKTSLGRAGEYNLLYLNGKISEVIFWVSDKQGDRTGIESNINSFYSIY